jgi:hypothetical protein
MGGRELRRKRTVRRIWESVTATVLGGLIVGSMTSSMSRPAPVAERTTIAAVPTVQAETAPVVQPAPAAADSPVLAMPAASEAPKPRTSANLSVPPSMPAPMLFPPPPKRTLPTNSIPIGSILLYEDFSRYHDGEATNWGPNTFIKTGLDRRNWLVSNVEGAHAVGCRIRLPSEFYFECRYAAYMPEVTRGVLGWWKEPLGTKISFLGDRGGKYTIQWVMKCGNDLLRPNPIGSPTLYAKKCFHTVTLPDGTANEIEAIQPTGTVRIERDKDALKVFVDGQAVIAGTIGPMGQRVGFEIDVVKAKNGTLFFTDFKIGR